MLRWFALTMIVLICQPVQAAQSTEAFEPGRKAPKIELNGSVTLDFTRVKIKTHTRADFLPALSYSPPVMTIRLVTEGNDVIPVARGMHVTMDQWWDYMVGPGKAWQEGKQSVASIPVTFLFRPVNCAHNGLVRLEYNEETVTKAELLVGQETCHFLKLDMSGSGKAIYQPGSIAEADRVNAIEEFQRELAAMIETLPVSQLAKAYKSADLALFQQGLPANDDLTTWGIYFDGKHYAGDCNTRHGPYPYCSRMMMTSFSTAKTAYPALVMMALSQEFGSEVYQQTVTSLIPEAADAPGEWQNVTLNHLGDMSSGNYTVDHPISDPAPGDFYFDLVRKNKLKAAFSWPNTKPAGEHFVYQTGDTFILVNAMDAFLRKQNSSLDSFDYLVDRILKPLNVTPESMETRRTPEKGITNSGTAYGGMGMWWNSDSVLKVARFMSVDAGRIGDQQILDPVALKATLQRDPTDRGHDMRFFGFLYNNGTWAYPSWLADVSLHCGGYVPIMSGLSGVRVFMMPNGLILYYFNDAQAFPAVDQIVAANQIKPFCEQ